MRISYKGPFLDDTGITGYGKSDGLSPKGTSVVRLSKDRFFVISVLNDLGGWDMNPAIVYQVREGSPVGRVLSRGVAMEEDTNWQPFGLPLSRCPQTSFAFGVPAGAKQADGTAFPNENLFVLQTFSNPQLYINGEAMIPHAASRYENWPADVNPAELTDKLPRVFWRHFKLNETGDDIEFLGDWELLRQDGYHDGYVPGFCAHGKNCVTMHAGFSPLLPADDTGKTWYTVTGFGLKSGEGTETENLRGISPLAYTWDLESNRYRWTATGPLKVVDGWRLMEPGIYREDNGWVVIARGNRRSRPAVDVGERGGYDSFWFRMDDINEGLHEPIRRGTEGNVPRMAFRCADGVVRIVFAEERWIKLAAGEPEPFIAYNPKLGKYSRDPLVMYDINPDTFEYSGRRVLFDAPKQTPVLRTPAADLVTITPAAGNKQWLLFRLKDRDATRTDTPDDILMTMGSHCIELEYDSVETTDWRFYD